MISVQTDMVLMHHVDAALSNSRHLIPRILLCSKTAMTSCCGS